MQGRTEILTDAADVHHKDTLKDLKSCNHCKAVFSWKILLNRKTWRAEEQQSSTSALQGTASAGRRSGPRAVETALEQRGLHLDKLAKLMMESAMSFDCQF